MTASGASRPANGAASASRPGAAYALRTEPRTNTVVVGPKESLARRRVGSRAGRLFAPRRVEAKVRYRSPATPASVTRMKRGFRLDLECPRTASQRSGRRSLRRRGGRRGRTDLVRELRLRSSGASRGRIELWTSSGSLSASSSSSSLLGLGYLSFRLAAPSGGFRASSGARAGAAPGHQQGRRDGRPGEPQLDKVDLVTDSAVDAAESVDTAVRAVTMAVTRPVQRISASLRGSPMASPPCGRDATPSAAYQAAKQAAERREREIAEELGREEPGP